MSAAAAQLLVEAMMDRSPLLVSVTPVTVTVSSDTQNATLEVANQGEPIAPAHLGRIFDRFYRVDSSRARDLGGTGLGLAIVKAIMGLHGGEVAATSSGSGETRFTLCFPRGDQGR